MGAVVVLAEDDAVAPPALEIVISVAEQKLALVKDGGLLRKYPISTSKFGLGDSYNSYKTPVGRLRVCDKIGDNLAFGAVLKSRNATGEILPVNSPGRDPIVTRILWLEGLESGNANAKSRGIYIHGTVEESRLGEPVSYGCIRMRSRDVVELFEETPVGTPVEIITDRFPRFRKAAPKTEILLVSNAATPTTVGPHGMVTVRTVRGGEPQMTVKEKVVPVRSLFAEADATPAAAIKQIAKAGPPPPPIAEGPTVMLKPLPPPQPEVVLSLKESILDSGLPKTAKAPPAPARVARVARVEPPSVGEPSTPPILVLQVSEPADAFASDEPAPLDRLSDHLVNPPAPQSRLAFRTSLPAPEL